MMNSPSFKIKTAVGVSLLMIVFAVASNYKEKINNKLTYVNQNSLSVSPNSEISTSETAVSNKNQTDLLGKELFAQYMTVRQSGKLNATTSANIAEDLASKIDENPLPFYKAKDLIIIENASKDDLKNYANKFWSIRSRYQGIFEKDLAKNSNKEGATEDSKLVETFIEAGNLYVDMSSELIKLPVPKELASTDLQIINNYHSSGEALLKLKNLDNDPFVSVVGLGVYKRYSGYEDTILKIIARYFKESGIIFVSDDPGSGWKTL